MPTQGEAFSVHQNINSFIALVFVSSFALGIGLIIWQAGVGNNPIADFLANTRALEAQANY